MVHVSQQIHTGFAKRALQEPSGVAVVLDVEKLELGKDTREDRARGC